VKVALKPFKKTYPRKHGLGILSLGGTEPEIHTIATYVLKNTIATLGLMCLWT